VTLLRRILWRVGWGAVGLLIVAFLIGYAAPYLPPAQFWWTDLVAVLLPPMGLTVVLVGGMVLGRELYRRRWGRVAVAGILLGLAALRFGPRLAGGGVSANEAETLRLMTFNLPPSTVTDSASGRALGRLVQQEAPDVLALQESWLRTGRSVRAGLDGASRSIRGLLDETVGYALPRVYPLRTRIHRPVLGQIVLDSMTVHSLPPTGDTDPRSRYTRTYFTWQGHEVVLYNIHLHTVGMDPGEMWATGELFGQWRTVLRIYREGALRRAEQARIVRRHIEQETRPVLVVGDFNGTPHQWAYRHIATGLRGAGTGGTFPARRPLVRIDHILAGPAWKVVSARVPTPDADMPISDHRPVAVRLRWAADYSK
jgi:endonuclease/exonuclease/phosphatase family metal-dependent hydrolase